MEISEAIKALTDKDNQKAHAALKQLMAESTRSNAVFPYFQTFVDLLRSENSYQRNRGLYLLAANARWDQGTATETALPLYLSLINDKKPITARQCIQNLPLLAEAKPQLIPTITQSLRQADPTRYSQSMTPLIKRDIEDALLALKNLKKA